MGAVKRDFENYGSRFDNFFGNRLTETITGHITGRVKGHITGHNTGHASQITGHARNTITSLLFGI